MLRRVFWVVVFFFPSKTDDISLMGQNWIITVSFLALQPLAKSTNTTSFPLSLKLQIPTLRFSCYLRFPSPEETSCQRPAALPHLLPVPERTQVQIPPAQTITTTFRWPHPAQRLQCLSQPRQGLRKWERPSGTGSRWREIAAYGNSSETPKIIGITVGGNEGGKTTPIHLFGECQRQPEARALFSQGFRSWEHQQEHLHVMPRWLSNALQEAMRASQMLITLPSESLNQHLWSEPICYRNTLKRSSKTCCSASPYGTEQASAVSVI